MFLKELEEVVIQTPLMCHDWTVINAQFRIQASFDSL